MDTGGIPPDSRGQQPCSHPRQLQSTAGFGLSNSARTLLVLDDPCAGGSELAGFDITEVTGGRPSERRGDQRNVGSDRVRRDIAHLAYQKADAIPEAP